MNREIKFRAWDKKRKIMLEVYSFGDLDEYEGAMGNATLGDPEALAVWKYGQDWPSGWEENEFERDSDDIAAYMQYTGLKDKNGKEIYEGDILEMTLDAEGYIKEDFPDNTEFFYFDEVNKKITYKSFVVFKNGSFGFMDDEFSSFRHPDGVNFEKFKNQLIIGNIFENPELLTNKNTNEKNKR